MNCPHCASTATKEQTKNTQSGPQRRKLRYFFLIQPDTVVREIPKVRVRPRKLLRS